MEEIYGLIAFRSRQAVLRFQRVLAEQGIEAEVVPTPSAVSLGCGLSVRFHLKDLFDVTRQLLPPFPQSLIGLYAVQEQSGRVQLIPLEI